MPRSSKLTTALSMLGVLALAGVTARCGIEGWTGARAGPRPIPVLRPPVVTLDSLLGRFERRVPVARSYAVPVTVRADGRPGETLTVRLFGQEYRIPANRQVLLNPGVVGLEAVERPPVFRLADRTGRRTEDQLARISPRDTIPDLKLLFELDSSWVGLAPYAEKEGRLTRLHVDILQFRGERIYVVTGDYDRISTTEALQDNSKQCCETRQGLVCGVQCE
jgi:mRNA-degrading endonuclease toxin of MazEF toxin-antitoxin module